MPKDFGPPERAPALPRKQTLNFILKFLTCKVLHFMGCLLPLMSRMASP